MVEKDFYCLNLDLSKNFLLREASDIHPDNTECIDPTDYKQFEFKELKEVSKDWSISWSDMPICSKGLKLYQVSVVQVNPHTLSPAYFYNRSGDVVVYDNTPSNACLTFKDIKIAVCDHPGFLHQPEPTHMIADHMIAESYVPRQSGIVRVRDRTGAIFRRDLDRQDILRIRISDVPHSRIPAALSFESFDEPVSFFDAFNWNFKDEHEVIDAQLAKELKYYTEKNKI